MPSVFRRCLPLLLVFLTLPVAQARGWSAFTHRHFARKALETRISAWGLDKKIKAAPFDAFLKKLSYLHPEIRTREDFARWLKINPQSPFDQPAGPERSGAAVSPYEILVFYSAKADDGRDRQLPYDRLAQFWFGRGTDTVSQAFRHMEKPPFDLFHPLNTFGFPPGSAGQATERAQIWFDLALLARRLGEDYWAWNFLGIGLHYIQDLQNPYHAAQLLPPMAIEGIAAHFRWGREAGKNLIESVTQVASNLHHFFEGYVDHALRTQTNEGRRGSAALMDGAHFFAPPATMRQLAESIRDFSNTFSFEAVLLTLRMTGDSLTGPKIYGIESNARPYPENPNLYMTADADEKTKRRIGGLLQELFTYQGEAIRFYVYTFLQHR